MKPKMFYDVLSRFMCIPTFLMLNCLISCYGDVKVVTQTCYVYSYLSYVELSSIILWRRKGCNTNILCVYLPFLC